MIYFIGLYKKVESFNINGRCKKKLTRTKLYKNFITNLSRRL